jgi:hypothetical protein
LFVQSAAKALIQQSSLRLRPLTFKAHTLRCSRPVAPDEYRWENFEVGPQAKGFSPESCPPCLFVCLLRHSVDCAL